MDWLWRLIVPDFRWTTEEKLQRATTLNIIHMAVLAARYKPQPDQHHAAFVYARDQVEHASRWVQ